MRLNKIKFSLKYLRVSSEFSSNIILVIRENEQSFIKSFILDNIGFLSWNYNLGSLPVNTLANLVVFRKYFEIFFLLILTLSFLWRSSVNKWGIHLALIFLIFTVFFRINCKSYYTCFITHRIPCIFLHDFIFFGDDILPSHAFFCLTLVHFQQSVDQIPPSNSAIGQS